MRFIVFPNFSTVSLAFRAISTTQYLLVLASVAVVVSAIAVIHSSHLSRQLFTGLQIERKETLHLEEDWGRLLIEQSTLAAQDLIQTAAENELNFKAPDVESTQVVEF